MVKFCKLDPLSVEEDCDSVDLVENPEQFTGYSGSAAHQVWNTVYSELCFHPEENEETLYLTSQTARKMCLETRTFYKLVSGLHSSILVHLCSNYLLEDGDKPVWGRNYEEFNRRIRPGTTDGVEEADRLRNIYFLYLVEGIGTFPGESQVTNSLFVIVLLLSAENSYSTNIAQLVTSNSSDTDRLTGRS